MSIDLRKLAERKITVFGSKSKINPEVRLLVLGAGGTGNDALIRTKESMVRRFDLTDSNGKLPENIAFLGIDTDQSVLTKIVGGEYIDPKNEFVHLQDDKINIKFSNKELLPDYVREWLNPGLLPPSSLGTGAGGVRQIGRYLLSFCYGAVKDKIERAIKSILMAPGDCGTLQIVLFSGIGGGTGSGTFIDLGYIVRQIVSAQGIASSTYLTSYLFLPDVNTQNPNVPSKAYDFIKRNGYAALQDLDYLMGMKAKNMANPGHELVRFVQKYGAGMGDYVNVTDPPYDSVYLVSNINNLMHPIKNGYEYALNIVAESVVNFVSKSTATDSGSSKLESVDVNGAAMTAGIKATNPDGSPIIGNYCYKAIGAATAELPIEDITNYIAKKFFDEINLLLEKYPTSEDMKNFLKGTKIDIEFAKDAVMKAVDAKPSIGHISPKDLRTPQGKAAFEAILQKYRSNVFTNIDRNMPGIIGEMKSSIELSINNTFQDINQGPFYANRLLTGYKEMIENPALTGMIDTVNLYAARLVKLQENAKAERKQKTADAARSYKDGMDKKVFRDKYFETYKDSMVAACMSSINEYVCEKLQKAYNDSIQEYARKLNNDIFTVYVTILNTLGNKFNSVTDIKIKGIHTNSITGREYRWQLVDIGSMQGYLDSMFAQTDIAAILSKFLKEMITKSEVWLKNSTSVMNEIENFIGDQFNRILSESMDSFLGKTFLDNKMDEEIKNLAQNANIRFPVDNLITFSKDNIWDSVSIPFNSPQIENKIKQYISSAGLKMTPTGSHLTDRILWLKVNMAIPAFLYFYLKQDEQVYESSASSNKGIHLYEGSEKNWFNLPTLVPEDIWGHTNGTPFLNERAKKIYDHAREIYRQAQAEKIVQSDSGSYFCYLTSKTGVDEKVDSILQAYKIVRENILCSTVDLLSLKSCIQEIEELKASLLKVTQEDLFALGGYKYNFYDIGDKDTFAAKSAVSSFIKMPEVVEKVAEEIDKRKAIDLVLGELKQVEESISKEQVDYEYYLNGQVLKNIVLCGTTMKCVVGEDQIELCNVLGMPFIDYEVFVNLHKLNPLVLADYKAEVDGKMEEMKSSQQGLETLHSAYTAILQKLTRGIMAKMDTPLFTTAADDVKIFYSRLGMFLQIMQDSIQEVLDLTTGM